MTTIRAMGRGPPGSTDALPRGRGRNTLPGGARQLQRVRPIRTVLRKRYSGRRRPRPPGRVRRGPAARTGVPPLQTWFALLRTTAPLRRSMDASRPRGSTCPPRGVGRPLPAWVGDWPRDGNAVTTLGPSPRGAADLRMSPLTSGRAARRPCRTARASCGAPAGRDRARSAARLLFQPWRSSVARSTRRSRSSTSARRPPAGGADRGPARR